MTRRAALLTGLAVLTLLLSGQVIAGWYHRPAAHAAALRNGGSLPEPTVPPAQTPSPTPTTKPNPGPHRPPPKPPKADGSGRAAYLAALGVKRTTAGSDISLTFDDGPNPIWTPKFLALLRAHHLHATFCVIGTEVRQFPALVAQIVREGHTLCNHSWHHELNLGSRSTAEIRANLLRTAAEIHRAAPGAPIPFFRQPGGNWTPKNVAVARQLGMVPIDWNVDPSDWDDATAPQIRARVLRHTRHGSIVLMHDGGGERGPTYAACRALLPVLKARFRIGPIR